MKEILVGKIHICLLPSFPASLLGVPTGYSLVLVGESGMIRPHMGKRNRSVMVAVHGTPCAIPRHKSNSNSRPTVSL
jgi:hypothetical protein